ncbi:Na(+)-translocating NADH-quinone reductase subunit C [Bacteroidia bacterium]|nr:Na(+)-translocating NADH-quinone reductase subunit C [Bacteroidia bacterium]GHU63344.1 Na(+)-translocating NADH-quinone reductase subunit C [Bacteroidia bacterium]
MNKESNSYTLIYAVVLVVVVALLLAFTSQLLRPKQAQNEAIDKISQILASVNVVSTHSDAEQLYKDYITDTYLVDAQGNKVSGDAFETELAVELAKPAAERKYPVFEAVVDGGKKYILSIRGAGLWGPIWGFISLNDDKDTVFGASFAHEGETPGLGAEIERPVFGKAFIGKHFFNNTGKFVSIAVVKTGKTAQGQDYVDGISGGTITSQGVNAMLESSIGAYEAFLKRK